MPIEGGTEALPVPPVPVPVPDPAPAPVAPAPAPPALDLPGAWVGQASGTPFELRLTGSDASLRGEAVFISGRGDRAVMVEGSADGASGQVTLSGGGLTFQGTVRGQTLTGTYARGNKQLPFEVSRSQ